jgi:heterodisulfide reductase subunit D
MLRRLPIPRRRFANTGRVGYTTIDGLAAAGISTVLSWCPSCQVQIGEVALPSYEARFGARPFDLNPFLVFLADHAEILARLNEAPNRQTRGIA